jgi:hypothetical protein
LTPLYLFRKKKEEGRRKKKEGRRKKEEGGRKKEEIFPFPFALRVIILS